MRERTYRIRKASELAGVPAALLRAWERRYGVLRPRRTRSGYRAYTASDVALLKQLKQLVGEGMAIGDAVQLLPDLRRAVREAPPASRPLAPDRSLLDAWQGRALDAAQRMDQRGVSAVLDEALALLTPLEAYGEVMVPLLREVGDRWHRGELGVAEEHLVTHEVRVRLLALLHRAPRGATKHVVCACLPNEDHDVGLLGAALRFRHAGWRVTFLGARTPLEQLVRAVHGLGPDLVALSGIKDPGGRTFRATVRKVVQALPKGLPIVIGGRAAEKHADVASLGVRVLPDAGAVT